MSDDRHDAAAEVGYGYPPTATRFKKGQSGNPSGKRKSKRPVISELELFLDRPIAVTEKGRRKMMRPMDIVRTKVFQLATQGNLQAAKLMFGLEEHLAAHRGVEERQEVDLSDIARKFDELCRRPDEI